MSYEIVKSIRLEDNKVYLSSSSNNVWPHDFEVEWESESLSKILAQKGKAELYGKIGESLWRGEMKMMRGNELCNLFLDARSAFPSDMNFMSFDSEAAGAIISEMVCKREEEPHADLSEYVATALSLRNDRNYILNAAKQKGMNFLNHADAEIQNDRAFALEVLKAGAGAAWFSYPSQFKGDKAFAMEALALNGCFYRELDNALKADREVIFAAFTEAEGKKFHEHLPDLIPQMTFFEFDTDPLRPTLDRPFIYKLMECCPSIHMDRAHWLLKDRDVSMKWVQTGKFFPHSVSDLPKEFIHDKEFQNVLIERFKGTSRYEYLLQRFYIEGVLYKESLDNMMKSADSRRINPSSRGSLPQKEFDSNR